MTPAPVAADPESAAEAPSRLAAAERTQSAVATKEAEARARLSERLRALHKRQRAGMRRMWVDPASRRAWLRARASAARVVRRDIEELAILETERGVAEEARERARAEEAATVAATPALPRRSLARPIAGGRVSRAFGATRDRAAGVTLTSRGLDLACAPGAPVLAVSAGAVRWSGQLAGRGAALVDHASSTVRFASLLVGLDPAALPVPGTAVSRGEAFARAAGDTVYLEIRLQSGSFGEPIDPAPLLAR